jgi:hypothetical protein
MQHIGSAAHIFAASPGGPRFDARVATDFLSSARNALWLCHNCHCEVDAIGNAYSIDSLLGMKKRAELRFSAATKTRLALERQRRLEPTSSGINTRGKSNASSVSVRTAVFATIALGVPWMIYGLFAVTNSCFNGVGCATGSCSCAMYQQCVASTATSFWGDNEGHCESTAASIVFGLLVFMSVSTYVYVVTFLLRAWCVDADAASCKSKMRHAWSG